MMGRQARRSGLVMGFDTHMIAGGRACSTSIPPTTSQTSPHLAEALGSREITGRVPNASPGRVSVAAFQGATIGFLISRASASAIAQGPL
jgi:hypothetical protein